MRVRTVIIVVLLTTAACSSPPKREASKSPAGSPSPSPTGTYDPNAPPGGGTFKTPDGRMRFTYPPPWHVNPEDTSEGYVALYNFTLTEAELARRESIDAYHFYDGEAKIEVGFGTAGDRSLAAIRRDECKVEYTTIKVRECTTTKIHNRTADWLLIDHSNDGDCTCREAIFIVGGMQYRFSGGGCIDCRGTPKILAEIERIIRSVIITR